MPLPPPSPNRQYVQVSGDPTHLDYLELIAPVFGGEMAAQDSTLLLYGPSFDEGGDLQAKGHDFLNRLNQAAIVTLDHPLKVDVGPAWTFDAEGKRTVHLIVTQTLRMTASVSLKVSNADGTVVSRYPEDQLLANARSAASRRHLDTALRLFAAQGTTWAGLYKIMEALQDAVGDLPKAGLCSRSELDRFSHTANCFQAAGDDARHARLKGSKPSNPMALDEARRLMRAALQKALDPSFASPVKG